MIRFLLITAMSLMTFPAMRRKASIVFKYKNKKKEAYTLL